MGSVSMADPYLGQLYRSFAAQHHGFADEAPLLNVRAIHERAAAKWLNLAILAEGPLTSR